MMASLTCPYLNFNRDTLLENYTTCLVLSYLEYHLTIKTVCSVEWSSSMLLDFIGLLWTFPHETATVFPSVSCIGPAGKTNFVPRSPNKPLNGDG